MSYADQAMADGTRRYHHASIQCHTVVGIVYIGRIHHMVLLQLIVGSLRERIIGLTVTRRHMFTSTLAPYYRDDISLLVDAALITRHAICLQASKNDYHDLPLFWLPTMLRRELLAAESQRR